jgi:hypothetical protein
MLTVVAVFRQQHILYRHVRPLEALKPAFPAAIDGPGHTSQKIQQRLDCGPTSIDRDLHPDDFANLQPCTSLDSRPRAVLGLGKAPLHMSHYDHACMLTI